MRIVLIGVSCALLAGCGGAGSVAPSTAAVSETAGESSPGSYKILYSFRYGVDGISPLASVTALNGTLYGTTPSGGVGGYGTFFSLTLSGKERVLHSFGVNEDTAIPNGIAYFAGTFYGTASNCTFKACGAVFAVSPTGKERVLYGFKSHADGAEPVAGLVAVNGALYGTTSSGGSYCPGYGGGYCGTVFAISTPGKERVIYRFKGGSDGAGPVAALLEYKGKLYGTTKGGGGTSNICRQGCGTVFEVSTSGSERVLHRFQGRPDGALPVAQLVAVNGVMYGTTRAGGSANKGAVFEVSLAGKERVVYSFKNSGSAPQAGLIYSKGMLYGTASSGGAAGYGTVFALSPSGQERTLHYFRGYPDGADPAAALYSLNGMLYGTTFSGGAENRGSVFEIAP